MFSGFTAANTRASEQASKDNNVDMPLASKEALATTESEVVRELSRLSKLIKDISEAQDKRLKDIK